MTIFLSLIRHVAVLVLFCLITTYSLYAQIRVGQGGAPDGSAAIDVNGGPYKTGSPYRGILPPKVALVQSDQATPVQSPAVGLLVYNTAKGKDVVPGYYYWDGSKWTRLSTAATGSARVAAGGGQSIPAYSLSEIRSLTATPDNFILIEPGREGLFRYVGTSSALDNDGTVLINATAKRYFRVIEGQGVDVKWFGAKGDGVTDDVLAIRKAVSTATAEGLTLIFPAGVYNISDSIKIDLNNGGTSLANGGRRASFIGAGSSNTMIRYTGADAKTVVRVVGTYDDGLHLSGLRIGRTENYQGLQNGTGLLLEKQVNFNISDLVVHFFGTGISLYNANEGLFSNVICEYNKVGLYGVGPAVQPNVLHFNACAFNSNTQKGAFLENGCNNVFTNCRFLGNGTSDNSLALQINYIGNNGRVGLDMNGCYLESNKGRDVLVNFITGGSYVFTGNTFNKLSDERYTTRHIEFVPLANPGSEVCNVVMNGNAAFSVGYTPRSTNKAVVLNSVASYNKYVVTDNNYYQNAVEKPEYDPNYSQPRFELYDPLRHKKYTAVSATAGVLDLTNADSQYIYIGNSSPTSISAIIGIEPGKEIILQSDQASTIKHNSQIILGGQADFTFVPGQTITLYRQESNQWREIARQVAYKAEPYDIAKHTGSVEIGATGNSSSATLDLSNAGSYLVYLTNSGSTTITNITGVEPGKQVILMADNTAITIKHNAGILLGGSQDFTFGVGQTITLYRQNSGTWREISRQWKP